MRDSRQKADKFNDDMYATSAMCENRIEAHVLGGSEIYVLPIAQLTAKGKGQYKPIKVKVRKKVSVGRTAHDA